MVGSTRHIVLADTDAEASSLARRAFRAYAEHFHATEVRIVVNYEKDRVRLSVCDNGCGFAPDEHQTAREAGEHFGLLTMRERAARISGRLEIVSSPGSGTTVETLIPVPAE